MFNLKMQKSFNKSALLMVVIVGLAVSGCQEMFKNDKQSSLNKIAQMLEPNVNGVIAFYDGINPFMWTEDASAPRGIVVKALYLEGPEGTGVFGDGIIRPKLYVAKKEPDGTREWEVIKEWDYEVEEAIRNRSTKKTTGGWGYRFHLNWGDLELYSKEIRLVIFFERRDGIMVASRKKDFRVPRRGY